MDRSAILSILAGAGIYLYGALTPDAVALARALQSNNPMELRKFADEHRSSPLARKAITLSKTFYCPQDRRNLDGTCLPRGSQQKDNESGYQS